MVISLQRVEFTSDEMVFFIDWMLHFSGVAIKFEPLLRSLTKSVGRLRSVKLWILLLEVNFSFSSWSTDSLRSFCSCSRRRAVL